MFPQVTILWKLSLTVHRVKLYLLATNKKLSAYISSIYGRVWQYG